MSDVELKPCPFCGGSAETDSQQGYRALVGGKISTAVAVYCRECSAGMSVCLEDCPGIDTETLMADLIERWNRRESAWLPMREARKDGTAVLLKFKSPVPRDNSGLDGKQFVGRHPGICDDGFDGGWNFAAPVGYGGIPDEWLEGWKPLGV